MRLKLQSADWVVAISTLLLLGVFSIFGILTWQAHGTVLRQAEERAAAGAKVVAAQARWLIGGELKLLDHLASHEAADGADLMTEIGGLVATYDAQGKPTSVLPDGAPPDVSTTDAFRLAASGAEHAITGVASDASIMLASRLSDPSGGFRGVAIKIVPNSVLEEVWEAQRLGPDSTVSLVRSDGIVVARFPSSGNRIDLSGLPVFKTLMAAKSGTYSSAASPVDGIARVIGFQHVDDIGLVAIAGVSQTAVLNNLWNSVLIVTLLLGPIAIALFLGSLLTARLLRRSENTRQTLAVALERNEVLFREIHHRVKNNLQSVGAIFNLQPVPREIKEEMSRRLIAMAAVHEHIYRSNDFGSVDLAAYLKTLVADVRSSVGTNVEIVEEYCPVRVGSDLATPLGLIVNEVISNCVKHAFPDGRQGRISLSLTAAGDGRATLVIADNGIGFDPAAPRKGIGQKLITALSSQVGGPSTFSTENGTRFEISFSGHTASGG